MASCFISIQSTSKLQINSWFMLMTLMFVLFINQYCNRQQYLQCIINYIANIVVLANSTSSGVCNQKRINGPWINWTKLNSLDICELRYYPINTVTSDCSIFLINTWKTQLQHKYCFTISVPRFSKNRLRWINDGRSLLTTCHHDWSQEKLFPRTNNGCGATLALHNSYTK
jgi:hypothetical protein